MSKTAFICSGQGSQYPGMGKELFENFSGARHVYECGSDILGYDLAKLSFGDDVEALSPTKISQPAIFAVSMAAYEAIKNFSSPDAIAGHSLGEYAALTIGGAFSLENGFRIISARANAMQKAADTHPGAMYAIIGSDESTIEKVCTSTQGYVIPVNFNSITQTVIAGEITATETAANTFSNMGIKVVKLAVASGFHSNLMNDASIEFAQTISSIPIQLPKIPFYCNITGKLLDVSDLKTYLSKHIISGVYFHQEISAMLDANIQSFIELGPNKVLTTLIKRNFKQANAFNIENLKTFNKWKDTL